MLCIMAYPRKTYPSFNDREERTLDEKTRCGGHQLLSSQAGLVLARFCISIFFTGHFSQATQRIIIWTGASPFANIAVGQTACVCHWRLLSHIRVEPSCILAASFP